MDSANSARAGESTIFAPTGRLTGQDAEALMSGIPATCTKLALDLTSLAGIDGLGLMALLRLAYACRAKGIILSTSACPVLYRIFSDCRLSSMLNLRRADPLVPFADTEWAEDFGPVRADEVPPGAGPNVAGRRATSPVEGFGELWLKSYSTLCPDPFTEQREAARALREKLPAAWPPGNEITFGPDGIRPGAVGAITLAMPGGGSLYTGVRVIHADDLSFTFATLQGHMASGWINFSASREGGLTAISVQSLARTSDPVFDAGFRLFGHRSQEEFWTMTLTRLVEGLRQRAAVTSEKTLVDGSLKVSGFLGLLSNSILPSMAVEVRKRLFAGKEP